jgi:predicted glycosyltransferase
MNREAAVLSVPVISLYSGDLLAVDRYLIEKELMVNDPNPALGLIKRIIESKPKKVNFDKLGKEALDIIIREIEEFRN